MTITNILRRFVFFVIAILLAPAAKATLPYSDGDLILGFRASGGQGATSCYEVNIGQASQFLTTSGNVVVDLGGNIAADLVALYGADWNTRNDVFWSISGVQFTAAGTFASRTIFASKMQSSPGVQSTPWVRVSLATQNPAFLRVQAVGNPAYSMGTIATVPGQTESTNSAKGLIQDVGAANSYASHMPGGSNSTSGSAYQFFVNGAFGIENSFANGTQSSVIDLYQLTPGSVGTPSTLIGSFRLNDSAQLTFNADPASFQGPAQVAFSTTTATVDEDDGSVALTIQRTGNASVAFVLNFSTNDGTALAGTDFTGQTDTQVSFGSGEVSKIVNVTIADLAGFQGDRAFSGSMTVASGNAQIIAPSTIAVNIQENDPQPTTLNFSAADYQIAENAAAGVVTITINRLGNTTGTLNVDFSTVNGTALGGTDFTAQSNTPISFADGQASQTVDVAITNRIGFFGDRTFSVMLSNPTNGASIGSPSTASVLIVETDANPAGQIAFSATTYRFASRNATGQPNLVVVTLNRTNGTTGAVSADVSLAAGGNLDAADFTFPSPTTVNFNDGEAVAVLNIPLTASTGPLPGTFNLTLSNPAGGAILGATTSTTVTIAAPDAKAPILKLTSPKSGKSSATFNVTGTVTEPDDLDRVTITLNGAAPQNATLGPKINGVTSFNLDGIAAENGSNTLLVQAFDVNGTTSKTFRVVFTYINERPLLAGSYHGIIAPTLAPPPSDDLNNASGFFTATVSKTGSFSGKINIGGATLPIKGVFSNAGIARFSPSLGTTLPLTSKGRAPVPFGALSLAIDEGTAKITGTIGNTATVDADRAHFDGKTVLVDPAVLANRGKFTSVLPSETQPALLPGEFPQGDGIGTVTISKNGRVSFIGRLADGTVIKSASALSKNYTWPLFAALYGKKGSIAGRIIVSLSDLANPNALSDMAANDLLWLRPENIKSKHYPSGWPDGVSVDFLAASYRAPQKGDLTSVFPGLGADDLLNGNTSVEFADGKLTAMVEKDINITAKNKITNAPASDRTFKVTLAAPTGAMGGNFTHSDGTRPKFFAIIYQKGTNAGAYGWFLSTVPKNAPSGESGGVSILAK